MKEILIKELKKVINNNKNTILVLKGFDEEILDFVSIKEIIKNKLKYFINLTEKKQVSFISYEEFLILKDLILLQYDKIIILNNNLYINYYPLNVFLDKNIITNLQSHYSDDKTTNFNFNMIKEYINIFSNILKVNKNYYITYNNFGIETDEKIIIKNIFNLATIKNNKIKIIKDDNIDYSKIHNVNNEIDFLNFINLFKNQDMYINSTINENSNDYLLNRILFINELNNNNLIFVESQVVKNEKYSNDLRNILKLYWGYDTFKKIKIYNKLKLDNKKRVIDTITQEHIMNTILNEVNLCIEKKYHRDIFVTAPTGAGKSAIFQIPAIYLAENKNLLTIVVSPLIGLMNDQINSLEIKKYQFARTINSDISPIKKQEILDDIIENKCHILYLSPETLLGKSSIDQLIGNRKIGLLVIDESHIVTTWGKQFRPDYWYLGDYIKKTRKKQKEQKGHSFVIATFTATSIYGGLENMYQETKQSLYMLDPHTFLGYIKRDDIKIKIDKSTKVTKRQEYELNKFENLKKQIEVSIVKNQKTIIYFPTVKLIERFFVYCKTTGLDNYTTKYNGQMHKFEKIESYQNFLNKKKLIMLATKAFGMGIDINDIEKVLHFAPTGNICDYVQEIGRVARKKDLKGLAYYNFMNNDFKHINRLHGISTIKKYQLVEVIKKVYELYLNKIKSNTIDNTKKRNEMLIDAENFSYIFENSFSDKSNAINKVKTTMLIIQKDFELKLGFSPINIRPVPLFALGYFSIDSIIQDKLKNIYGENSIKLLNTQNNICSVNLKIIWEKDLAKKISFPKFKYLLYSKSDDLKYEFKNSFIPSIIIDIFLIEDFNIKSIEIIKNIKNIFFTFINNEKFYTIEDLEKEIQIKLNYSKYKSKNIADFLITSINIFSKYYHRSLTGKLITYKPLQDGSYKYKFNISMENYFKWINKEIDFIKMNKDDEKIFLTNINENLKAKELLHVLGILEILELLTFKSLGGNDSQIYIYINQTQTLRTIIMKPYLYKNRLLELVSERHNLSVEMLSFLYDSDFSSEIIWDNIENYFLGILPEKVKIEYENKYGKKL